VAQRLGPARREALVPGEVVQGEAGTQLHRFRRIDRPQRGEWAIHRRPRRSVPRSIGRPSSAEERSGGPKYRLQQSGLAGQLQTTGTSSVGELIDQLLIDRIQPGLRRAAERACPSSRVAESSAVMSVIGATSMIRSYTDLLALAQKRWSARRVPFE
jgi:hypothetical protein